MVVCIPGMGQLRSVYRFIAPSLRDAGFRVVSTEIRGMGDSSSVWPNYSDSSLAGDLSALLTHLDGGPAALIGNSIAGSAAVCVAAERPMQVSKLVLVTPVVRTMRPSWGASLLYRLALGGPWGARAWVNYQLKNLYPTAKPSDWADYDRDLLRNLKEPGRLRGFRRMAFDYRRAAESRFDRVRAPTLVVMGGADPDFPNPTEEGQRVARGLRGTLSVLPGLGHYPFAEQPSAFLEPVLRFLHGGGRDA
jgi:pimeloyl-ACP methyl ester carboxylesterase